MADGEKKWYVKTEDGKVYGPASVLTLVSWAKTGQIMPFCQLSQDRRTWIDAPTMPELEMKWLVETEPGKVFGPFNRAVVIQVVKDGMAPEGTKFYRLHEYPIDQDPPPKVKIIERVVEKEAQRGSFWSLFKRRKPEQKKSVFAGLDRSQLIALEAAARQEMMRKRQLAVQQQNLIERK